jgi:hypothetical protein
MVVSRGVRTRAYQPLFGSSQSEVEPSDRPRGAVLGRPDGVSVGRDELRTFHSDDCSFAASWNGFDGSSERA